MRHLVHIICCLAITGCAGGPKISIAEREAWITQQQTLYNSSAYLSQTGAGSTPEIAKIRARSNLAQVFSTKISSQISLYQNLQTDFTGSVASSRGNKSYVENTTSRTDQVIEGSQILGTHFDDETLIYTAFIALNRGIASRSMSLDIQDIDLHISVKMRLLEDADQLGKISVLASITQLLLKREELNRKLRIVSHSIGRVNPFADISKFRQKMIDNIQTLPYRVVVDEQIDNPKMFQRIPVHHGFIAVATNPKYEFAFSVKAQPVFFADDTYWQRARIYFDISAIHGGQKNPRGSLVWDIKIASQLANLMSHRLNSTIDKILRQQFLVSLMAALQQD